MISVMTASRLVVCTLPVPPPLTIGTGATCRTASTTAARRSASSAAERRFISLIRGPCRRPSSGRSPTPAMWAS